MRTTQREARPWWNTGPHSAQSECGGTGPETPNASGRARAREDSAGSAQSSAQSDADCAVTPGDKTAGYVTALRTVFSPPDIWSHDRPALSKVWSYEATGEWTAATGAPRFLGKAYGWVSIPVTAALYLLAWVIERPARLAATIAFVAVLAQFPPLSWLI